MLSNKGLSENCPLLAGGRPAKIEALERERRAKREKLFLQDTTERDSQVV